MSAQPELLYPRGTESGAELGEGLTLFPDAQMKWVDLLPGRIFSFKGENNHLESSYPHEVAKVLPWNQGSILLGRDGLIFRDHALQTLGTLRLTPEGSAFRCSDGAVLPDGTLVVGIMDRDMAPECGSFLHIGHQGDVHTLVHNTSVSNGVAVLLGGTQLVWTDSPTQKIFILDIDPHTAIPGSVRVFAEIPGHWGVPDGLAADSEGGVWVALWGGGAVRRLDATGTLTHTLEIPVMHPTSVAFDATDNLWVTTAAVLLSPAARQENPGAGGVWRWRHHLHGFRGLPVLVSSLQLPGTPRE